MQRLRDTRTGPACLSVLASLAVALTLAGPAPLAFGQAAQSQTRESDRPRLLIELPLMVNEVDAGTLPVDMSDPRALEMSLSVLRERLAELIDDTALAPLDTALRAEREGQTRMGRALSGLIPRSEDRGVLPSILEETGLDALARARTRNDYVPVGELAALTQLQIGFSARDSALTLTVPLGQLRAQSISLRQEEDVPLAPDAPAQLSAFLNTRLSAVYIHESEFGPTGREPLRADFNGAARLFGPDGPALVGDVSWIEGADRNPWRRGDVFLLADNRSALYRARLGDVRYATAPFQGLSPLLGLVIEREYDTLAPSRLVQPSGRYDFILQQTSLVRIVLNGAVVRTLRLRAGRYDVRDFSFFDGANEIEVVIEDDAGRTETLSFSAFSDKELLAPGLSEFSYAIGYPFERLDGETDYNLDRLNASFRQRIGLTRTLTLAVDGQSDGNVHQLGGGFVHAGFGGAIALNAAASHSGNGGGWDGAIEGAYEARLEDVLGLAELRFDIAADYTGPAFTRLGEADPLNEIAGSLSSRVSLPLPGDIYASLGGRYEYGRAGRSDSWGLNAALSRPFGPLTALVSLSADEAFDESGTRYGAFISLSWRLGQGRFARTRYDSLERKTVIEVLQPAYNRPGSVGWTAAWETEPGAQGLTGDIAWVNNRFEAEASHVLAYADPRSNLTDWRSRASVAFGLGYADGRAALGRPVGDGFAILSRHPNLGDRVLTVQGAGGEASARSGLFGPALLPDLSSYRAREIGIVVDDLPPGYDLGRGEFEVFPAPFSGYRLDVGSSAAATAIGTLNLPDGTPLMLVGGEAVNLSNPEAAPVQVFTNRRGRFVAAGLSGGTWRVTFRLDRPYAAEFEVEDTAVGLVDTGALTLSVLEANL